MSKEEISSEDYHYGLIHSCIFCDFLYSLSFRDRIGMDSGVVHYNVDCYSIELDVLSNEELENKYKSIKAPWWNFLYENTLQRCKVLLFLIYMLSIWISQKTNKSPKKEAENTDNDFWMRLYKEYYRIYKAIERGCKKGTIASYNAKTIFCNLPASKLKSYPSPINKLLDKSHQVLYAYCVEKDIISPTVTYEGFCNGKGFFNDSHLISMILERK